MGSGNSVSYYELQFLAQKCLICFNIYFVGGLEGKIKGHYGLLTNFFCCDVLVHEFKLSFI